MSNHNASMEEQTPRSLKISIGLLTALLWLAALGSAAYWYLRYKDQSSAVPANARELNQAPPPQAVSWSALAPRFGVQAQEQVPTDIKVLGIVLPAYAAKARAVLMVESTKTTQVAEVGKEIADGPLAGAVIQRITTKEVTLQRSAGNVVKLAVPETKEAHQQAADDLAPNGMPNEVPNRNINGTISDLNSGLNNGLNGAGGYTNNRFGAKAARMGHPPMPVNNGVGTQSVPMPIQPNNPSEAAIHAAARAAAMAGVAGATNIPPIINGADGVPTNPSPLVNNN